MHYTDMMPHYLAEGVAGGANEPGIVTELVLDNFVVLLHTLVNLAIFLFWAVERDVKS